MKRNAIEHANTKQFHVLPLLVATSSRNMAVKKNPNLKISIDRDIKKSPKSQERKVERPLTATLEKPTIIDIRFVGKIDMSLIRKEFLNITNLCRIPLVLKKTSVQRPLSLPSPLKIKHNKKNKTSNIIVGSCENVKSETMTNNDIISKLVCSQKQKVMNQTIKRKPDVSKYDANNNHPGGNPIQSCNNHDNSLRKRHTTSTSKKQQQISHHSDNINSIKLVVAEPCKSCGRKNHPERFHSHPPLNVDKDLIKSMEKPNIAPVKSTVQKPLAMKYVSKINSSRKPIRPIKTIVTSSKSVPSSPKKLNPTLITNKTPDTTTTRSASGKITLTCYLCGREFGTYSLPLHEPKCLQKWEAANANLPKHLQRKPPVKPSSSISKEERDILAWEASQSTLIPCQNCGRTFHYDRLIVHKRSCYRTPPNTHIKESIATTEQTPGGSGTPKSSTRRGPPPTFECYICGRTFGVNSIGIHERHCLKKWTVENDLLPPDIRSPPPVRKEKSTTPDEQTNSVSNTSSTSSGSRRQQRSPLFPCYICGKLFTVNSIYIHEPQCLKIWHNENDKLPSNRQRPQPIKSDIKFTPSGGVDFLGTFNRIWDNHLAELVECRKCGRKFFPDRIEKHEKVCANIKINVRNNLSK